MSEDKRQSIRVQKNIPSQMFTLTDQLIIDCVIVDLSEGGARIAVNDLPEVIPDYFKLKLGSIMSKCRVRWRKGSEVGVQFFS